MSVIVKGMDMPNSCAVCEYGVTLTNNDYLCSRLFPTGNINRYVNDGLKRPEWCPLVALPEKHGRLIDGDEFKKSVESYSSVLPEERELIGVLLYNESAILESEE